MHKGHDPLCNPLLDRVQTNRPIVATRFFGAF
jgi:hypothetical protein